MTRLNWKYDKQYDCYVSDTGIVKDTNGKVLTQTVASPSKGGASAIRLCCKGYQKTCKGFTFRYHEPGGEEN